MCISRRQNEGYARTGGVPSRPVLRWLRHHHNLQQPRKGAMSWRKRSTVRGFIDIEIGYGKSALRGARAWLPLRYRHRGIMSARGPCHLAAWCSEKELTLRGAKSSAMEQSTRHGAERRHIEVYNESLKRLSSCLLGSQATSEYRVYNK